MSHYTVTVLLPRQPKDVEDLNCILADLLAPFDENEPVAEPYKDYYEDAPAFDVERSSWNWPYCVAAEDGLTIDPENLRPVAEHLQAKWPEAASSYQYEEETNRIYDWTTYNPNSRWDWWVVGGRWTGYMPLKAGAQGITGSPSWGNPEGAKPGWVDCIRKGDIDEHAVLAEASRQALEDHEKIEAKVLNGEKLLPWDEVMPLDERINAYTKGRLRTYAFLAEGVWREPGKMGWFGMSHARWVDCIRKGDIDEHAVLAEASRQALEDHEKIEAKVLNGEKLLPWDEVMPLDERINAYTKGRLRTYAFLAEGVWREPGKMGWFGMSHATPETEDDYAAWWERMWAAMPDDAWLAVVDCHI